MFWKMLRHRKISFNWKMFTAFFAFALVIAHVTAELPSFFHACGVKDPNYDQCAMDNTYSMKDAICKGMLKDINVLPNQALPIDDVVIYDTDNLKLYLKNATVHGICDNFIVQSVRSDLDRLQFDFDVLVKQISMNSIYDFDIHILVPLANKGQVFIRSKNDIKAKIHMDLKVATKHGEKQIYASKVKTNINITEIEYELDENRKELIELHKAIRSVVDSNVRNIIVTVSAAIEKKISEICILIFNYISRSNYEKLFPENA